MKKYQVEFWSAIKGNWQFVMVFNTMAEAELEKTIIETTGIEARIITL